MPDRTSPLRRVTGRWVNEKNQPFDVLECGHRKLMAKHIVDGDLHYESLPSRRCQECAASAVKLQVGRRVNVIR